MSRDIRVILSDTQLDEEFLQGLYRSGIDQKFLYRSQDQAMKYYKIPFESIAERGPLKNPKSMFEFLDPYVFLSKDTNTAFVSLGCGKAIIEKEELSQRFKKTKNFEYFGVDSSMPMLELATETLKNVSYKTHFVYADIGSGNFVSEFTHLMKSFPKKIFSFFGNTFANTPISYTANSLFNIMKKGDFLFFDVYIRKEKNEEENARFFMLYRDIMKREKEKKFYGTPLYNLGIPENAVQTKIEMSIENKINSLRIQESQVFQKPINTSFRGMRIAFAKEDEVSMQNFYIYDPESLVQFMENQGFEKVATKLDYSNFEGEGLFLFKKK